MNWKKATNNLYWPLDSSISPFLFWIISDWSTLRTNVTRRTARKTQMYRCYQNPEEGGGGLYLICFFMFNKIKQIKNGNCIVYSILVQKTNKMTKVSCIIHVDFFSPLCCVRPTFSWFEFPSNIFGLSCATVRSCIDCSRHCLILFERLHLSLGLRSLSKNGQ